MLSRYATVVVLLSAAFPANSQTGLDLARRSHPSVEVGTWVTTHDQTSKLRKQRPVWFSPAPWFSATPATNTIYVDESQVYQEVEGFGAAMTDSSAYLLNEIANPAQLPQVMHDLFTREGAGIGISFVRNPMGASDLARSRYSYDDLSPGETDPTLARFSIAHDQLDIIPLLRQAKALNPDLKIMANPWSPPGWMKMSGSMIGGSLLQTMYSPFADYFARYIKAYEAEGLNIDYISLQNEPLITPGDYPGMYMDSMTQTRLLRDYVLPAFTRSGISTRVLIYDHNWDNTNYPDSVLFDQTLQNSPQVAGIAWHGYAANPGFMWPLHTKYPGKGNWQTESSGGTWVSDQVRADFENIILAMRSWAKSWVKWGIALDQNMGPHTGGCGTCTPIVTVNTNTGAVTPALEYYTLGHFSKFVLPGAKRIYSSNGAGVITAAFANPNGSKALVAFNDSYTTQKFQVQWGTLKFNYSLPSFAAATFLWSGPQTSPFSIPATSQVQASSYSDLAGLQPEPAYDSLNGYDLGYADTGDYAVYKNIDFGSSVRGVDVRVASAGSGGTIEFHLDSPTGPQIALASMPVTGGWQNWITISSTAAGATGTHDLYVVLKGGSSIGNINWFQFK